MFLCLDMTSKTTTLQRSPAKTKVSYRHCPLAIWHVMLSLSLVLCFLNHKDSNFGLLVPSFLCSLVYKCFRKIASRGVAVNACNLCRRQAKAGGIGNWGQQRKETQGQKNPMFKYWVSLGYHKMKTEERKRTKGGWHFTRSLCLNSIELFSIIGLTALSLYPRHMLILQRVFYMLATSL